MFLVLDLEFVSVVDFMVMDFGFTLSRLLCLRGARDEILLVLFPMDSSDPSFAFIPNPDGSKGMLYISLKIFAVI